MGGKANYLSNKDLDLAIRATAYTGAAVVYSALYTVAPSASTAGTEVTNASSGYTRVATTFCTAGITVAGQSVNIGAVTFVTAAAAYTIIGWGLLDTSTVAAGNLLYFSTVTTLALSIGDQATFAIGGIVVQEA